MESPESIPQPKLSDDTISFALEAMSRISLALVDVAKVRREWIATPGIDQTNKARNLTSALVFLEELLDKLLKKDMSDFRYAQNKAEIIGHIERATGRKFEYTVVAQEEDSQKLKKSVRALYNAFPSKVIYENPSSAKIKKTETISRSILVRVLEKVGLR